MIKIQCEHEGIRLNIYEMMRLKFPQYENKGEIFLCIDLEDKLAQYLLEIDGTKLEGNIPILNLSKSTTKRIQREIYYRVRHLIEDEDGYGILTGMRPTKLYRKLQREGKDVLKVLKEDYALSHEKISLLTEIVQRQNQVLDKIGDRSYNIYIHIPFCPSKCSYCSFDTIVSSHFDTLEYVEDLIREMKTIATYYNTPPHSIYIGGGTPSSIPVSHLELVIQKGIEFFGRPLEFTVECGRLDTLSKDLLKMLAENGVNRISINPQTFNTEVLKALNRDISLRDINHWMEMTWGLGIESINMDLIIALPGDSIDSMINSMDRLIGLSPQNITIHHLALKKGAALPQINGLNQTMKILKTDFIYDKMVENKYRPYYLYRQKKIVGSEENLGYSREGFESLYNILMMEELEDIIGFGMSASSKFFRGKEKFIQQTNYRNMKDYHKLLDHLISKKSELIHGRGESI